MWPFSSAYPERSCNALEKEYDYIIVGGGTAGCVLANRLSEDPSTSVLLVERGHPSDDWASRVPLFSQDFKSDGSRTWKHESTPQAAVKGRKMEVFAGKALGGTSRVNAMLYTRGMAAEYEGWKAEGRKGWGFDDVLPLFKKDERYSGRKTTDERGRDGVWATMIHDDFSFKPTEHVFAAAGKLGLPLIDDQNDSSSPAAGAAKSHYTIDENGHRASTQRAFLPPDLANARKNNLTICTGTLATKLDIKPDASGDSLKIDGVFLQAVDQRTKNGYVSAKKQTILCSGPLANPKLLMLSGIGPKEHLETHGIPVLKDLPAVGAHLQDHVAVPIVYDVPLEHSLVILEKKPLVFFRELFKYLLHGKGLLLAPVVESMIFARSALLNDESHLVASPEQLNARDPANKPDIEIMPLAYDGTGTPFDKTHGKYGFLNVALRPFSRGTIRLASSDPTEAPVVDLNTLSDPRDWEVLRQSLKLSMQIAETMTKDKDIGYEMKGYRLPKSTSKEDLDEYIIEWARTTYHYSSTCHMAPEVPAVEGGEPGVVNDELQVYGVNGLRIADSSIFPQVIATHLQAPTVMVAEKCAVLLKTKSD